MTDWGVLYQKDPLLFDPGETPEAKLEGPERDAFISDLEAGRRFYGGAAYEASRSEEEKAGFRSALHETMDLWCAAPCARWKARAPCRQTASRRWQVRAPGYDRVHAHGAARGDKAQARLRLLGLDHV